MGEVVDVASVIRAARQIRGIYPTNGEMISRLADVLTGGGHIVWVVRLIRETQRMSSLVDCSRAECIRCVENHLCANGVAVPAPIGRVSGEAMLKLAADQKHTDATIDVTGPDKRTRRFHAHTSVLVAGSNQLATRLGFGLYGSSRPEPAGVLSIEMMDPVVFELLMRFIYTGALVPLHQSVPSIGRDVKEKYLSFPSCPDVLASLVLAADMYVVPGLVRECMDFVDSTNALVVMREAAQVDTEETNILVEACASVLVHDAEQWKDPRVLVGAGLPLRAVYAIAAQMLSSVHRIHGDALKARVRGVWEAVRAWYGGATLLEIQAALLEGGMHAGMLIDPYKGDVDLGEGWNGTDDDSKTTTTVFGAKYDVHILKGRRFIEVRARDAKYSKTDYNAASSMSYLIASSPKLVTVSTDTGHRAHAVLGCAHGHIGLAVDDGDSVTVEVNPIFSLITAAAALALDESTAELVQGLQIDVLRCILGSGYTSCDAREALRAVAAREAHQDEAVCALTDKLAHVPVGALIDVLKDVPALGRLDSFSRLLVGRIVAAPDTETRETELVGLIKCICAAPVTTLRTDPPEPEPERKVARLV